MPFDREQIKSQAAALAAHGVYLGTSSWKYELCRAQHNSYFQDDVPRQTPLLASSAAFTFACSRLNGTPEGQ